VLPAGCAGRLTQHKQKPPAGESAEGQDEREVPVETTSNNTRLNRFIEAVSSGTHTLARTEVRPDIVVSTVQLMDDARGARWNTLVMGGPLNDAEGWYRTVAAAVAGHEAMVARVEAALAASPHAALIAGLRELADFFEQHPDLYVDKYAGLEFQPYNTNDADGIAVVEAYAAALGTEVDRRTHVTTTRRFGGLGFKVAKVLDGTSAEFRARQKLANAARWVFTCADGTQSQGHESEADARVALAAHMVESGCPAGHLVRLVSGELDGSVTR
jgi:hypothetical protein